MASGKPLVGQPVRAPFRVWYWNGEDPVDEMERRVAAICLHHEITEAHLGGRLSSTALAVINSKPWAHNVQANNWAAGNMRSARPVEVPLVLGAVRQTVTCAVSLDGDDQAARAGASDTGRGRSPRIPRDRQTRANRREIS